MFTFRPGRNGGKNGNGGINGHNGFGHENGRAANGSGQRPEKNGFGGPAGPVDSVIGPGIHYQGALTGAGGIRIEGSFDGDIKISGTLVVADGAKVTGAEIRAGAVSVAGTVKAKIIADRVEILSTGRIYGDLVTRAFASEDGAFLRGQIVMQDQAPEAAPPRPERPA